MAGLGPLKAAGSAPGGSGTTGGRSRRWRGALRVALSSYVANGVVAGVGLLLISALLHLLLGPAAAAAATVGIIVVTPPDQPGPRRGKFVQLLPGLLLGPPLFLATSLVRGSIPVLMVLLVAASFVAFLGAAWGRRGVLVSVSLMFSMLFALATPTVPSPPEAWQATLAFSLGAWIYACWSTAANALLNARLRVLALVDALDAVADLMRTQGLRFTLDAATQQRTLPAGRLMKQQVAAADRLQAARDILLEAPAAPRRLRLAGMLLQLLDLRDHLLACALDLEALRSVPQQQELLHVLGIEIQALAGDVERLADDLLLGRRPAAALHQRPVPAAAAALAPAPSGAAIDAPPPALLAGALARRVGYLHDEVARMVALARGELVPDAEPVRAAADLFVSPTQWTAQPLRALWRRDAPPLRHAIRAALAIAAGYAVGVALPWGSHEYWILVTITVVLRGSFAQTVERRDSRMAGTIVGCGLAGLLLYAHPSPVLLLLVVAVAQAIAHAFALQRYLVTAVAASVLGLVQAHLLDAGGAPLFDIAERMLDTLIGVAIAWLASYVLPSWEHSQVGALVLRARAAQAEHAALALAPASGRAGDLEWRLARREAYDSLSALVQSVQRSLAEPRTVQLPLPALERWLEHNYQLLAQLTSIRTLLRQQRSRLDLELLREPLAQGAGAIVAALQPSALPPAELPPVRGEAGRDLGPLLLRRLRLAVGVALQIRADAGLDPASHAGPQPSSLRRFLR